MKVSIIGTTGYGGGELLRILAYHPVFEIQSIHSSRGEKFISEEYPHLNSLIEKKLEKIDIEKISTEADLVFLATPSSVSSKLVGEFAKSQIKIVDLSGDLRLKNSEDYEKWYRHEPAEISILEQAVYGLSEWNKPDIIDGKIIANPGCYPTATLLGLAPVVMKDCIDPNSIIIDAKSGVSGAGRTPSKIAHFAEISENINIYKVNEHQHIPEIEQQLLKWNEKIRPITFSTHLIPIGRGIMTTIYGQLTAELTTKRLIELYQEMYDKKTFVRIRPEGQYPAVKEVRGSNYCDIGINVDERTGRVTIISVIDNLMKGAAGQAVQNANLMFGLDETLGLEFIPLYP
ncbi:N-acetyl-gamma-glutamyl-phosphate reductase [Bacillus aquiflavi]|uniref:N-acetyl-gamma-glutamyl-phosphate reductase n=1 Tax=Bacillus aquiflavi TaxID=2672567 RepID=A0A6B3VWY5_9BACI|nr:N-acetyl-gamma-glutamyl-phosphate reductase [Bacillus aquiflavi]MBA4536477.1 N-acetyl-gamma-glutamyl-phosphate reductase [Bacillus aquiflavi]NEY80845.1 N-acetyl-gamma-glutamyl-phosphate reductase [Bacillus aquiflavi]UAC49066.1 N-acetyl-gamma-glutamyl-phosphate reductase [Bacillus aquiflavi]